MKSCWKKGCIVYCIMAAIVIPLMVLFTIEMSKHSDKHPGDEDESTVTEDALAAPFGLSDDEERMPLADTDYINLATGDKWGFVLGVSGDGSEPINIAHFMGNGMQGRDMYELRSGAEKNCYVLYQAGSETDCGITIFVYPGADSIRVTRDGRMAIFKTAASFDHAVSSIDPDYTPERYAIKMGDHGGKFETLQSGEEAYTFPSGEYARSQWVKDGNKLYYVDVSGCKMKDNYAHDGFYAGSDGSWNKSVRCINGSNLLPQNGASYVDDGGKSWVFQLATDDDGTIHGTAHQAYPKDINFEADYTVKSFGSSAYSLFNVKNDFDCWHAVVLDGGRTLRVSGAGVTEVYHKK